MTKGYFRRMLPEPQGRVVLVYGLGRTPAAMFPLAYGLRKQGFDVHFWSYFALRKYLDSLSDGFLQGLPDWADGTDDLHFVGHSLGGIILRAALAKAGPLPPGRLVLIAAPNQGSALLPRLPAALQGSLKAACPALAQLEQGAEWIDCLPPPRRQTGIVTCTESGNLMLPASLLMAIYGGGEASDGTVEAASSRLPGMADYLEVERSHSFALNDPEVARSVGHFLRHGHFAHKAHGSAYGSASRSRGAVEQCTPPPPRNTFS